MKTQSTIYPCIDLMPGTPEGETISQNIILCLTGYEKFFQHLKNCPRCKPAWIASLVIMWHNPGFVRLLANAPSKSLQRCLDPMLPKSCIPYKKRELEKIFKKRKEEKIQKIIDDFFK